MKKIFTKEVRIAITACIALVLLFFGINFLKGINLFSSTETYYIDFKNVNGLAVSSQVYADGYQVGIVRGINYNYDEPGKVLVKIDVDRGMRLPKGSTAMLEQSMLGGATLNLLLANNPRERYAEGDTLKGEEDKGLTSQVATLMPKMESILNKLDSLADNLNRLTADPALSTILHNTAEITGDLTVTTKQLNTLLGKDVPALTHKLNVMGDNMVEVSGQLRQLDIKGTMARVNNTLANVEQLSKKLNSKDNSIGLLLNDRDLYDNMNSTMRNASETMKSADNLLIDFKERPKRYVHFSLFGKKDK